MRSHLLLPRTVSPLMMLFVLIVVVTAAVVAQPLKTVAADERSILDELLKSILANGFTIDMPALPDLKSQVEIHGDLAIFNLPVTVRATDAARDALESAARRFGGQMVDAFFEADYGIVSWEARAFRLSSDPGTLEYIQRRIGSLAFVLRLVLDNGQSYACRTDDVWRIPITPISQLFNYGGRASIQGLGISEVFNNKDSGFIAARKKPITFIYRGTMPASDFAKIVKMDGMIRAKVAETENECVKASGGRA
jgi:hypothetical protein